MANLRLHVLIVRIEPTQSTLESVNVVNHKLWFSNRFNAFHHLYEPASRFGSFISQKQRSGPFGENQIFGFNLSITNKMYFPGLWNFVQQDVGAYPTCSPSRQRQWLSLLDDVAYEKMLWNDEEVEYAESFEARSLKEKDWDCCLPPIGRTWSGTSHLVPYYQRCFFSSSTRTLLCRKHRKNLRRGCCSGMDLFLDCHNSGNKPNHAPIAPSMPERFASRWYRGSGLLQSLI